MAIILLEDMIIQLVSFLSYKRLTVKERLFRIDTISSILNETEADFVMFSVHVLKSKDDLFEITRNVHNKNVTALFELDEDRGLKGNRLYLLQKGEIKHLSNQLFSTSEGATRKNIELLSRELSEHRKFEVNGKRFLIVLCGENNILKGSTGTAEFRLQNRPDLKRLFTEIVDGTDIVLNPVHSQWGRFGNYLCRMRKFSESKRYSFSCTQISDDRQLVRARENPGNNVTHVAMHSKRRITPVYTNKGENYLLQKFNIQ